MRVLHVLAAYHPSTAYGGPVVSAHQLIRAQAAQGAEVSVLTTDADGRRRVPLVEAVQDGVLVRYHRAVPLNAYGVSPGLFRALWRDVGGAEVIHCHGTMLPSTTVALWAAARHGTATVVSPRGSMMRWATRKHRLRKAAYRPLERRWLEKALIHATSQAEAEDARAMGFERVVVVENAVDVEFFGVASPVDIRARLGLRPDEKLVAWIGRFDTVKNLEVLVEATRGLGARLVLAGAATGPYAAALRARLDRERRDDVVLLGHADDETKRGLLQAADAYAHPSFMESFGMSIAEALASGCPVVASTGTPWAQLDQAGAGRCVPPTAEAFRGALGAVLAGDRAAHRGAALALAARFAWPERARALLEAYRGLAEVRR